MTVTGIAGCTALMVTGFGLRDSMIDIARTQFEELLGYDLRIELRESGSRDAILAEFLNDTGDGNYAETHGETVSLINDEDEEIRASLYVPRVPENFSEYIKLRDRKTRRPLGLSQPGAVVSEKMAAALKLRPGDDFSLERADGSRGTFTLSGITENYVGNYIYLSPAAYISVFGGTLSWKTLFVRIAADSGGDGDRILTRVLSSDAVTEAEFTSHTQQSYTNLLNSIGFVVLVLIFAAGGLAMIVLYNLTYININERSRELATLRVLGFHQREAAAYIFREISILSIAGAAAGLLLGIPLHRFVIGVAENVDLMFGRRISGLSCVLSVLLTILFSFGVDLLMVKKIHRIKMAESMKAMG
jgi:putative ABC transport system permease protein